MKFIWWVSAPGTVSSDSAITEPLMCPGPYAPSLPMVTAAFGARIVPGQAAWFFLTVSACGKFHSSRERMLLWPAVCWS